MPPFINTEKVRMRPLYARSIERQPHPKIPGKQKKKKEGISQNHENPNPEGGDVRIVPLASLSLLISLFTSICYS